LSLSCKFLAASPTFPPAYQLSDWIFVTRKINIEFEQTESQKRKIKRIAKRYGICSANCISNEFYLFCFEFHVDLALGAQKVQFLFASETRATLPFLLDFRVDKDLVYEIHAIKVRLDMFPGNLAP
jgi:hypothetical protein